MQIFVFLFKIAPTPLFIERLYIYKIIKENFNKPIEINPDLSKFDINTYHLCDKATPLTV